MTHIAPTAVANTLDALAGQLDQLANTLTQQAPAQTAALGDRMLDLARMVRRLDFRRGVQLGQIAEKVGGRALARPFQPYTKAELGVLAATLRATATAARDLSRRPATQLGGGDAA